jgi:hypothetical protein
LLEAEERALFDVRQRKALAARVSANEEEADVRAQEVEDGEREIARYRKRIAEIEREIAGYGGRLEQAPAQSGKEGDVDRARGIATAGAARRRNGRVRRDGRYC